MSEPAWRDVCRRDIAANRRYPKSLAIVLALRVAQLCYRAPRPLQPILRVIVGGAYRAFTEVLLGVEIPASTTVGAGLRLRHAFGVVVNPATIIGDDVMLRHGVTLGNRVARDDCPIIESDVEIGAGAIIIGRVTVGRGARIGAGAVVTQDVPAGGRVRAPKVEVIPPSD